MITHSFVQRWLFDNRISVEVEWTMFSPKKMETGSSGSGHIVQEKCDLLTSTPFHPPRRYNGLQDSSQHALCFTLASAFSQVRETLASSPPPLPFSAPHTLRIPALESFLPFSHHYKARGRRCATQSNVRLGVKGAVLGNMRWGVEKMRGVWENERVSGRLRRSIRGA